MLPNQRAQIDAWRQRLAEQQAAASNTNQFIQTGANAGSAQANWGFLGYNPTSDLEISQYAKLQEDIQRQIDEANRIGSEGIRQGRGGRGSVGVYQTRVGKDGEIERQARAGIESLKRLGSSNLPSQFQTILGRDATPEELDHFAQFIKSGDLDSYEIQQILQSMPEAQKKKIAEEGKGLEANLAKSDQQILGRAADIAQGRFAAMGRPGSSGMGSQILSAGQDLAAQRQSILANFYGNNAQGTLNQYQDYGNSALERAYGLGDERRRFGQEMSLANLGYQRQQDMYRQQQRSANRGGLMGVYGGLLGATAGGFFPGGGALVGATIGSQLGQYYGRR